MATKVFVGNLSFSTQAETLKAEFEKAGNVLNANIITRGPRSLGYGFVELATPEAASKSVEMLHQQMLDGRQINVEIARPRPESDETEGASNGEVRMGRRHRTNSHNNNQVSSPDDGEFPRRRRVHRRYSRQPQQDDQGEVQQPQHSDQPQHQQSQPQHSQQPQRQRFRRAYRPRQNSGNRPKPDNVGPSEDSEQQQQQPQQGEFNRRRPRMERRPRRFSGQQQPQQTYRKVVPQGESPVDGAPVETVPRRTRRPPRPRPQQDTPRLPSETTLFVANLPFVTTDEELKTLFSKHAPVVGAHVVTRKNGRSKGFGFVEFSGKDDQAKALQAVDGTEYNKRVLNVKVALKVVPTNTDAPSSSEASTSAGVAPVANGEVKPSADEAKGKDVDHATA